MNYFELKYSELNTLTPEQVADIQFLLKYEKNYKKAVDTLGIGDLTQKKFGVIKEYQTKPFDLSKLPDMSKDFEFTFNENIELYKAIQGFNYVVESLRQITDIEKKMLTGRQKYSVSQKELEKLGYYWQIRELAGNDVTKIELVENTKYALCFLELLARKRLADYTEKVNEEILRSQKNNH